MLEMEQGAAWARSLGFTIFLPYFDRDVVELSLRMHPEHLICGGWSKAPLRRLVAERLPRLQMRRKKVDFGTMTHQVLRSSGGALWRRLASSLRTAQARVVCSERVEKHVEDYFRGDDGKWLQTWLMMSTEAWVQEKIFNA